MERLKSRKFWLTLVAATFSVIALFGYDMPIDEVMLVDALTAVGILALAIVDVVKEAKKA